MDADGPSLVPIVAVLFVVLMAVIVVLVVRFVKPRREIGEDFFGAPRPVQPTQPDIEDAPPTLADSNAPALPPASTSAALAEVQAPAPDATNGKGHHVCQACGQVDDPALVDLEDWLQVKTWMGRRRADFGRRNPIESGRALYADRFLCRGCAKIAHHLNDVFTTELELDRKRATATFDAREQNWQRVGLLAAVKRQIDLEDERYRDEQDALKREDTRRRARKADL